MVCASVVVKLGFCFSPSSGGLTTNTKKERYVNHQGLLSQALKRLLALVQVYSPVDRHAVRNREQKSKSNVARRTKKRSTSEGGRTPARSKHPPAHRTSDSDSDGGSGRGSGTGGDVTGRTPGAVVVATSSTEYQIDMYEVAIHF